MNPAPAKPNNQVVQKSMEFEKLKTLVDNVDVKKRFQDVLGTKANQFISSLISVASANNSLRECEPGSVIRAALVAASLDLPIDTNLGFAAIVPYNSKDGKRAQFQIMAKGFIQLAIRTGQYAAMNYSEVYEDEIVEHNPITKEIKFVTELKKDGFREKGMVEKIVGYYAWFRLNSGFRQAIYLTVNDITNHAKKYSASFKTDLTKGWSTSMWTKDFDPMAKKTVIKLLLSKWGILSIQMQKALSEDQKVFDDGDDHGHYGDRGDTIDVHSNPLDPFAENPPGVEHQSTAEQEAPQLTEEQTKNLWETGDPDKTAKPPVSQ